MNNFCYMYCTNAVVSLSLILLIVIMLFCLVKRQFKIYHGCIIFACIFVIYAFIPIRFHVFRFLAKHPEHIETVMKFSINPHEKRICYKYIAQIYKNNVYKNNFQNMDKAIYYMEKAINGDYIKYRDDTIILAHWYSLKGDWDNTIKLNNIINNSKGASLRNAYIMNNEYQKAINAYSPKENSLEIFLTADLYKNIKNYEEAKIFLAKAQKLYNFNLNKIDKESERIQYIENTKKYRTVNNYKQWLNKKCLELKS